MRLALVRSESGGWKTSIERPDIEILDAAVTVKVVEGSPLREHYGEPARAVLRAAISPSERLVVSVGQSRKVAQVLVSKLFPRPR